MTITPRAPFKSGDMLTALCVWRESRGESSQAKLGVVWTIRNRCRMAPAQGFKHTMEENILKPWAFSSFNADDPNSDKYPSLTDPVWQDCLKAATSQEPDPTGGACFYFSKPIIEPPKAWGETFITAVIGGLTFCSFTEAVS